MDNFNRFELHCEIVNLSHAVTQELRSGYLKKFALTFEQCQVLCHIYRAGGEDTVSNIAKSVLRMNHTISARLNTLEARGMVTRHRESVKDRRKVFVSITPKGTKKLEAVFATFDRSPYLTQSSQSDLNTLIKAVQSLSRRVKM